jgi:DNA-binding PadR family transcriptional regulator
MNSTRLFILNALAKGGPMYGHQIRRAAQLDRTELWTTIQPGSLYGALHRMATEGVVEVVRTEREGKMPARTVYAITGAGRQELVAVRDAILRDTRLRPDPVDLALQAVGDLPAERLAAVIANRRATLAAELASRQETRNYARPYLGVMETVVLEHALIRLEAEIRWHDRLLATLPATAPGDGTRAP